MEDEPRCTVCDHTEDEHIREFGPSSVCEDFRSPHVAA